MADTYRIREEEMLVGRGKDTTREQLGCRFNNRGRKPLKRNEKAQHAMTRND